jgi:hypothetical protein
MKKPSIWLNMKVLPPQCGYELSWACLQNTEFHSIWEASTSLVSLHIVICSLFCIHLFHIFYLQSLNILPTFSWTAQSVLNSIPQDLFYAIGLVSLVDVLYIDLNLVPDPMLLHLILQLMQRLIELSPKVCLILSTTIFITLIY